MKKYAFFALLAILLVMGGCRASDCGCPMSSGSGDKGIKPETSGILLQSRPGKMG